MRNILLEEYNAKKKFQKKLENIKKTRKFIKNIENSKSFNLLPNKMNKLAYHISNIDYNNQKKLFKKNLELHKNNFLKNKSLKTCLKINTNYSNNNKYFIKKFENLFQHTTNNNIVDYFNGQETEKMGEFAKRIKEYNYNDFFKTLKRKNINNSKTFINFKQKKKTITLPYNFKGYSYSQSSLRTNKSKSKNEKNDCWEYASMPTARATSSSIRNFGDENKNKNRIRLNNLGEYDISGYMYPVYNTERGELHCNFDGNKNNNHGRSQRKSFNYNTNKDKKLINIYEKANKFRSFSFGVKNNKINKDNSIHSKLKKNLNLI
jgi:hypothetical protein